MDVSNTPLLADVVVIVLALAVLVELVSELAGAGPAGLFVAPATIPNVEVAEGQTTASATETPAVEQI